MLFPISLLQNRLNVETICGNISLVGVGAFDDPLTPQIQLTEIGKVTEKYLLSSENIPGVKIDRYVVMPDHIHVIIFLYPDEYASHKDGSSR